MNYCYALKLPKFETIVNDGIDILDFILSRQRNQFTDNYLFYTSSREIFKLDFLKSFNNQFTNCHCFYKLSSGGIHIDLGNYQPEDPRECWGINWNFGSSALYDYWNFEDIDSVTHCLNEQNQPHTILQTKKSPRLTYTHHQGPVLFNATVPHRARISSKKPRYAVSLRMSEPMMSWQNAVEMFNDFIVNDETILQKL
jgi:hypothetical protein